jgi:histidine ammonia-lyase
VVAIEWIAAAQAIWLQKAENDVSPITRRRLQWLRQMVPPVERDMSLGDKIEQVAHAFLESDGWQ